MLDRRTMLCGGLLTVLSGPYGCCHASGHGTFAEGACDIGEQEAKRILEASTTTAAFLPGSETMTHSSGNKNFDLALAHTLARQAETFQVLPAFAFFKEPGAPNAFASSAVVSRSDGTVLFGFGLLKRLFSAPEYPEVAISAVCAHEFAHILQMKRNLRAAFAKETTVRRVELHADFLAGYFAGLSKLRKPDYPAAVYASTMRASGDNKPTAKAHHGTPEERAAAIVQGFDVGFRQRKGLDDAVRAGMDHVWRI